jgi:hypothetical protein
MKKASASELVVKALWDTEAAVWVATSDDVPGLVTESETFETLLKKLRTLGAVTPEVKRTLKSHDCRAVRQGKGDHEIWFSPITNRNFRSMEKYCPATPRIES